MALMVGSIRIADVQVGSKKIAKIVLGAPGGAMKVIWEKQGGGPVFVEEKHEFVALAGAGNVHDDPMEINGWGWLGVKPVFGAADRKVYFEIHLLEEDATGTLMGAKVTIEDIGNSQEVIGLRGDGVMQTHGVDQVYLPAPGYDTFPVVMRLAIDIDNGLFWGAFDANDWNKDSSADPSAGIGGISFTGASLGASGANIIMYLDESGDVARAALHAHDFLYSQPAGFSELIVDGEYA